MNESVSILMPTYNSERYIVETLDSISNQDCRDFKVYIFDSFSTDRTIEIIQDYEDKFNIEIFSGNANLYEAWNYLLNVSLGEFVYFLPSDDIVHPQCISIFQEHLKLNPKINIVCSQKLKSNYVCSEFLNKKLKKNSSYQINEFPYDFLIYSTGYSFYESLTQLMLRKSFINKHRIYFPQGYGSKSDFYFSMHATSLSSTLHINYELSMWRIHEFQATQKKDENYDYDLFKIVNSFKNVDTQSRFKNIYLSNLKSLRGSSVFDLIRQGRLLKAFKFFNISSFHLFIYKLCYKLKLNILHPSFYRYKRLIMNKKLKPLIKLYD